MGLGSIKVNGKKFNVKEELGHIRLTINYMDIVDVTELKGLNKLINVTALDLSNNKIKELRGLDELTNLQQLFLSNNQIEVIEGLE
ncbi:MAG: leucine-rich repeat domain-containing protein, partial [Candidatus Lokiarchaeota archaeon]|nr:leucine-rich repeat domain-containing protein [Candidatus Lokiarchaeota archaeon]